MTMTTREILSVTLMRSWWYPELNSQKEIRLSLSDGHEPAITQGKHNKKLAFTDLH